MKLKIKDKRKEIKGYIPSAGNTILRLAGEIRNPNRGEAELDEVKPETRTESRFIGMSSTKSNPKL